MPGKRRPLFSKRKLVRFSADLLAALEAIAEKKNTAVNEIIREACRHYISKYGEPTCSAPEN